MNSHSSAITADRDTVLTFDHVSRRFGDHLAVDEVQFDLQRGEILTLLGPSGCGKTTTLRVAIGLERAQAGRVSYNGRVVDSPAQRLFVPPNQRDMGMVFQSYAIWPHLDVFENVAFPLRTRRTGNDEVERRVKQILVQVGLGGYEKRSGMQLSGGQQQRVAVARGLVAEPDLLLMDEPFSNLDAKLRTQLRVELRSLQRRLGVSILFVTHDQSEALALSDRLAVMRDGRIVQIGTPLDLYMNPAEPFVRDFLGESVLFAGRVGNAAPDAVAVTLDGGGVTMVRGRSHLGAAGAQDECIVAIRPEDIVVHADPVAGDGSNHIAAKIRSLLFLGQEFEAVLDYGSAHVSTVRLRRDQGWREGQNISLELPAEKLQVWRKQS